jgi:hypothetical protein
VSIGNACLVAFCIVESNGGTNIYDGSNESVNWYINNTAYAAGGHGFLVAGGGAAVVQLLNNVFKDNGNAAGEYNVAGIDINKIGFRGFNVMNQTGGAAGNLQTGTLGEMAPEPTGDPLFTDAANGDFSIGSGSPAKAAAHPGAFLSGSTGYLDMGAVQRQEAGGGGGGGDTGGLRRFNAGYN